VVVATKLDLETQRASEEIGERIRKARTQAGLSQETLAGNAGMKRASFARIEYGKTNVTIDSLLRIAKGLGLELQVKFVKPSK
jgi:transcriptional regulator with XRE-family HTH domain